MLTRLEVDGFKNLLGFEVDFGPFTCIAGPNAVGKSNIFDAIEFLSALADHALLEGPNLVRATNKRVGDPRELFWTDGGVRARDMRFAVEMIVPDSVEDDFGRVAEPSTTYMRYELELGYEGPVGMDTQGRLVLRREQLAHITRDEARTKLRFEHSAGKFRNAVLKGHPTGKHPFIWTETDADGQVIIRVSQDKHGGRPSPFPAYNARATIISSAATTEYPTILAARREMQSWRRLALEPAAMREPDEFWAPKKVAPNGANVAATLYSLANYSGEGAEPDPDGVYAELANRMSALVPVRGVRVDRDDKRELLTIELEGSAGGFLPARALSDGMLRFLALAVLDIDPSVRGVLCMEEPENGIHPARLEAMVDLVCGLAIRAEEPPSALNPLRQIIVNTHSPGLVRFVHARNPGSLLIAKLVSMRGPFEKETRALRLLSLSRTWRTEHSQDEGLGLADLIDYLSPSERHYENPPGAQLALLAQEGEP
ncbi:AAA family ATPase [Pseudenhygromyxa sp. WMMC2535]|uniref:AAA family ATPase n=1 Tax=Pseudenhygromyxa sp. WMMC2535 TaxID=2712867 RepID=UPI001556B0CF|nr:AAA family ATPase [Pseudenhygromyxa sp. WMMC2535]NVB36963.1 AAA family ATPase [Pseudenhygromyxa sp. WMMC2535]